MTELAVGVTVVLRNYDALKKGNEVYVGKHALVTNTSGGGWFTVEVFDLVDGQYKSVAKNIKWRGKENLKPDKNVSLSAGTAPQSAPAIEKEAAAEPPKQAPEEVKVPVVEEYDPTKTEPKKKPVEAPKDSKLISLQQANKIKSADDYLPNLRRIVLTTGSGVCLTRVLCFNIQSSANNYPFALCEANLPDLFMLCEVGSAAFGKRLVMDLNRIGYVGKVCDIETTKSYSIMCYKSSRYSAPLINNAIDFTESKYGRYASVVLRDMDNNQNGFLWMGVHMPFNKEAKYQASVKLIKDEINRRKLPVLICGDFNKPWTSIQKDFEIPEQKISCLVKNVHTTIREKGAYGIDNVVLIGKRDLQTTYFTDIDTPGDVLNGKPLLGNFPNDYDHFPVIVDFTEFKQA